MVRRDDELRLSAAVQARYRACGDDGASRDAVTNAVQRQVAREAGFAGCVHGGVDLLQACMSLFPNRERRGNDGRCVLPEEQHPRAVPNQGGFARAFRPHAP